MVPCRILELETAALGFAMSCLPKDKGSKEKFKLFGLCYWTIPVLAVVSIPWSSYAVLLNAFNITGALGALRMTTGSPAATSFYSIGAAWRTVLFSAFAWAMATHCNMDEFKGIFSGLATGLVCSIMIGISVYICSGSRLLSMDGRLASLFFNPGWFAQYVCLTFPFCIIFFRKQCGMASLAIFASIVMSTLILTMTRASWIVFPLALLHMAVHSFRVNKARMDTPAFVRPSRNYILLIFLSVALAASVIFFPLYVSKDKKFLQSKILDRVVSFTKSPRPTVFLSGILIGTGSPLVGYGYETYAWRYQQFASDKSNIFSKYIPSDAEMFETTHNFFIQLFCGIGLIGLGVWLALITLVVRRLTLAAKSEDQLAIASLSSLVSFHVFGIFQEMTYVPPVWIVIFIVFGYAMHTCSPASIKNSEHLGSLRMVLIPAIVLFFILALIRREPYAHVAKTVEGMFPPELINGRNASWTVGTASFVLAGDGPWKIVIGSPPPTTCEENVRVLLLSSAGKILFNETFSQDGETKKHVTILRDDVKDRIVYVHSDNVQFPALFHMADQRVLGVNIELSR